jgi:hypothetical protein
MQSSEIFANLDAREIDYVKARANAKSNRQALKDAKLSQGWLQNRDAEDLFNRAMAFKTDAVYRAQEILDSVIEEAAQVKANGLKVRDERIKQSVATEILDRKFGKPTQRSEVTGKDGGTIIVKFGEPIPPRSDE